MYSNRVVKIKTEGPISLVGPTNQALVGGQLTLYFNSLNEKGKAKITINIDNEEKVFDIEVK